jgi:hypothetical protein
MVEEILDNKDRVILTFSDNGKLLVGRFPDMTEGYKKYIANVYADTVENCTEKDIEELMDFLNFEDEDDEFCV